MAGYWTTAETAALVGLWGQANVQAQMDRAQRNATIYQGIAREMEELGYSKS